jgi:hypothetical protein
MNVLDLINTTLTNLANGYACLGIYVLDGDVNHLPIGVESPGSKQISRLGVEHPVELFPLQLHFIL